MPVLLEVASVEPSPMMQLERTQSALCPIVPIQIKTHRKTLSRPIISTRPNDLDNYNSLMPTPDTEISILDEESCRNVQEAISPKFSSKNSKRNSII